MKKLIAILKSILIVPSTFDPDDLRRRRIMNAILVFMIPADLFIIVTEYWGENLILAIQAKGGYDNTLTVAVIFVVLEIIFLWLNRSNRLPRDLIRWIFVISLIGLCSFADTPRQLTVGRTMFIWAIPVTLSVVILPPASVFLVDLLIIIVFLFLSGFQWMTLATYTLVQIYVVSFISWIGMSIAERAIRDARNESRKNAAILEGVAEGVIVLGRDNQILLANRAASELLGTEMVKITSMTERAEMGGRALSFHWSEVEGVGRVAIVRDISRQVEIDHAKDAILRVVSHEMRTPLAAILGFTEVLTSASISISERLERIHANARRMMTLVNDLLDQAYIEAGALKMQNESFTLTTLANLIQDAFCARARDKQIELNVVVADSLPEAIIGDLHRYQQILNNLVDNAIKFTKEIGCVDVLFAPGDNADEWQMVVRDTGIGIPPERLPDIFLPFRRASDYAKRRYQGAGLGLSIAKRIAQLAHGDIQVKSAVGQGSTFIVTLPINGGA